MLPLGVSLCQQTNWKLQPSWTKQSSYRLGCSLPEAAEHLLAKSYFIFQPDYKDNDTTETYLRLLLKKLHKYSLEVWEFRNGVLHGATNKKRRHLQTELLREKVTAAYDQYAAGKILLFARDHYIFTKKTVEIRLAGDDDTLLGWLRLLEVAMMAYAREHMAEQLQATRFFAPFRLLGHQKLSQSHLELGALLGPTDLLLASNTCNHRQREEEQLLNPNILPVL